MSASALFASSGVSCVIFSHRPLFLFTMIVAPILCIVFLTTLMADGLPTKLPAGLVDEDDTHITHIVARILGSMEETDFVARYPDFSEAKKAMQRGEIYVLLYSPWADRRCHSQPPAQIVILYQRHLFRTRNVAYERLLLCLRAVRVAPITREPLCPRTDRATGDGNYPAYCHRDTSAATIPT